MIYRPVISLYLYLISYLCYALRVVYCLVLQALSLIDYNIYMYAYATIPIHFQPKQPKGQVLFLRIYKLNGLMPDINIFCMISSYFSHYQ